MSASRSSASASSPTASRCAASARKRSAWRRSTSTRSLLVSTDEICAAIQDIFEDNRTIAEPAGALAVAGIKRYVAREQCRGQTLVALNCGANVNFDRLRHVAERADIGAQREALLAVEIPEEPGSFLRFCRLLGRRSVTEFNYRYDDARSARIFAGVVAVRKAAARRRPCSQSSPTPAIASST